MNAMLERLKTVTPAVLSAWNEDGSFDEKSYRALVHRCVETGMGEPLHPGLYRRGKIHSERREKENHRGNPR